LEEILFVKMDIIIYPESVPFSRLTSSALHVPGPVTNLVGLVEESTGRTPKETHSSVLMAHHKTLAA